MVIDCHTHIFNEKLLAAYLKRGGSRVDRIITIHDWDLIIEGEKPPTIEEVVSFAKSQPNISVIASVDIRIPMDVQLKNFESHFRAGDIVGIKLYPGYQPFYVSEARFDALAELCTRFRRPLVIHGGDVYDPHGTARLIYSHPIHVDELAARHPQCPIVIAHFGFPYFIETVNVVSKHKHVYTDFSATVTDLPPRQRRTVEAQFVADLRRAFAYYPDAAKKTMFGTDYCGEHTYLTQVEPYFRVARRVFDRADWNWVFAGLAQTLFFD